MTELTITVADLIAELEEIKDKDAPVYVQSIGYQHAYDFEVTEASNDLESCVFLRVLKEV